MIEGDPSTVMFAFDKPAGDIIIPSVAIADATTKLPQSPGVYLVCGFEEDPMVANMWGPKAESDLLYIGSAKNMRERWRAHHRLVDLLRYYDLYISWFRCEIGIVRDMERKMIQAFEPPLNGKHSWRYIES
jgi:excinuclease UvrABC nuclease subunit